MYSVEADRSKRLIVISAGGRVTRQDVQALAAAVRELVQDFAPGFRAVTEFRFLETMESAAAPHVGEIMDALAAKQVATVVRVMPDPRKDIGFNILSRFHYGPDVFVLTVETMADAIAALTSQSSPDAES
jgi:hypothetical protein